MWSHAQGEANTLHYGSPWSQDYSAPKLYPSQNTLCYDSHGVLVKTGCCDRLHRSGQEDRDQVCLAQKEAPWIFLDLTHHLRAAGSKSGLSMGHSCLGKKKDLQIQDSVTLPTIPPVPSPFSLFPTCQRRSGQVN